MSDVLINRSTLYALTAGHIALLTLSNLLVQYPFRLFGFHTTWGAFTYPAIFILTDLTVRLSEAHYARLVILRSMIPAFFLSYCIASYLEGPAEVNWLILHIMPLRIAFACFLAYAIGQILDVFVFQKYRNNSSWWVAPILSSGLGNIVDTFIFFSVAFYQCSNLFLSQHWMEIASIDLLFKMIISWLAFVPVYGLLVHFLSVRVSAQA